MTFYGNGWLNRCVLKVGVDFYWLNDKGLVNLLRFNDKVKIS
jgi:hypothetical protein